MHTISDSVTHFQWRQGMYGVNNYCYALTSFFLNNMLTGSTRTNGSLHFNIWSFTTITIHSSNLYMNITHITTVWYTERMYRFWRRYIRFSCDVLWCNTNYNILINIRVSRRIPSDQNDADIIKRLWNFCCTNPLWCSSNSY